MRGLFRSGDKLLCLEGAQSYKGRWILVKGHRYELDGFTGEFFKLKGKGGLWSPERFRKERNK